MTLYFSNDWKSNIPSFHYSSTPARKAGLTLIEVMLAVVILGIGAGGLMLATARCISVLVKARHYSEAHRLIFQVEAENPLSRGEIEDGTTSGTFENGYTWTREITESDDEDREGLYTVRTRISWGASGNNGFEEIITLYYIEPEDELGDLNVRSR